MNFVKVKAFLKKWLKKLAFFILNSFSSLPIQFFIPDPFSMIPSMFLAAFIENRIEKTRYLVALGWQILNFIGFVISAFSIDIIPFPYFLIDFFGIPIFLSFIRALIEKN
jgi:hypothetical protein